MPDVPLVNVSHSRIATILTAPRTSVVVRDIAEGMNCIRKDFFVKVAALGRRERGNVTIGLWEARQTYAGKAVFLKSASWSL